MRQLRKHRKLILLFVLAVLVNVYWIVDLRRRDEAQAQACMTILPQIRYGVVPLSGNAICLSQAVNLAMPGVGFAWVGMTGWQLEYNTGGNDHEVQDVSARITGLSQSASNVNFNVQACLNGDGQTYNVRARVAYVAVRWR